MWVITKAGLILNRAVPQLCLAASDQEVRLQIEGEPHWEAYKLILQKRKTDNIPNQLWRFTKAGHIYCKAYPGFPLTYLKELDLKEEVTQKDCQERAFSNSRTIKKFKEKAVQSSARKGDHKQEWSDSKTQPMPKGDPEGSARLTVALARKLKEKHPQAAAQRWAIKHEGITKPGQWKHSVVENPLWNKLTYMWPMLPDGNLNENFEWPIEGSLLPNVPSLKMPAMKWREIENKPVRVLRNGHQDKSKAVTVTGPDIINILKKTRIPSAGKPHHKPSGREKRKEMREDGVIKAHTLEFKQCLERCTWALGLPFAARRLFDEKGKEITVLKDLQRDQLASLGLPSHIVFMWIESNTLCYPLTRLITGNSASRFLNADVYVSCGERWTDPKLTLAEQKKRLHLNSLASDIALIRSYCAMRHPEGLVLEVVGGLVAGAKLTLAECAVAIDQGESPPETDKPDQPHQATGDKKCNDGDGNIFHTFLDSHARAHLALEVQPKNHSYPWERNSKQIDEDDIVQEEGGAYFTNAELYNKYRPQPKAIKHQQIHRQQFEFRDGYMVNCSCPWLVVGVPDLEMQPNTEVVLVERKADEVHHRWILREEDRTFHLMGSPELVLAVSMPQVRAGDTESPMGGQRCSIILQKYKGYSYGVANQKWCWIPEMNVLNAFYTTTLDQEITAANQASLCTFSVSSTEEMEQPGYYFTESGKKQWITVCLACAKVLRGKIAMTKLPAGISFICATGCKASPLEETGPFKCLSVAKLDLSTSEAGNSLSCWEEKLISLRKETSVQTLTQEISAARAQRALKLLAYRNGAEYKYKDGQLIIGTTFSSLLSTCTRRLELTRPASRLYTLEGTQILTISELIAWAVNDLLRESGREAKRGENAGVSLNGQIEEESARLQRPDSSQFDKISAVMPEDLESLDPTLITIVLRNPIEVWVSCGEAHVPLSELNRRQRLQRKCWLQKEKVLCDLNKMKHIMRHLQGRRVGTMEPATMVPTKSPIQPVVVEGGWSEPTPAEVKLMEEVQNMEMHLSEVQAMQVKRQPHVLNRMVFSQRPLYSQPNVKRVLAYLNGGSADQGVYAWGKSIPELLVNCTERLHVRRAAQLLFTPDGEQINTWEKIERDMLVCVSAGEPFLTSAASRQRIEVRANYSRVRKEGGPDATNIIILPRKHPEAQAEGPSPLLALLPAEAARE
ncbi:doublecortin domain-containing protein 1 [Callorhinchus milii]|uniref:doublecortin domain-containing protein 1 n=1 Tax=Callorhinchus milii TaxID=7868 RepID=UPI001C3F599D|nr:doublecortin domain-containing protein 1 [Callorhinchus milii]